MSPDDITRGKILSPETIALLETEAALLAEDMLGTVFSADPIERETAILRFVEAQAKRNVLMQLVAESAEQRATLVASQS